MVRVSEITKRYGSKSVVDDVSLEFQSAQTYALIGPSGCGKSTLLRIIMGLIPADSGTVWLHQKPLSEQPLRRIRQGFGYVIQSGGLFPHLTCRENATLPASYRRWSKDQIADRLDILTKLTDLPEDTLDRYPAQLSGGQRQRVSLIRALMLDPDMLLLDEPLAALDPMIRNQLQTELKAIFQELKKTVILVTHDLHEAAFFADKIILMQKGKVAQTGTIRQLQQEPASPFVTDFIAAQRGHLFVGNGG